MEPVLVKREEVGRDLSFIIHLYMPGIYIGVKPELGKLPEPESTHDFF